MTSTAVTRTAPDGKLRRFAGTRVLRGVVERRLGRRDARRALVAVWSSTVIATALVPLMMRLEGADEERGVVGELDLMLRREVYAGLLGALVLGWMLRAVVRGIADLSDSVIDERQLALRDRAYRSAYRIAGGTVHSVLIGARLAADIIAPAVAFQGVSAAVAAWIMSELLLMLATLFVFLPSAVLAWRTPDEIEDEVVEDVS